ncbi:MAG: hypothetical protein QM706_11985 [Nitrospira sp.]
MRLQRQLSSDNRNQRADEAIRILSPEMAATKLGWPLKRVLAKRAELGLETYVPRR